MAFPWLKPRNPQPPSMRIEQKPFLLTLQSNLNSFFSDPSSFKAHLDSAVQTLGDRACRALISSLPAFSTPLPGPVAAPWARISSLGAGDGGRGMSTESIEERLAGVPVYALSNAAEEFVLVSGVRSGKNLGLFCFKEEDAQTLLDQMRSMNQDMREGSKVVAVALNKVFQLKVDGVAFRFVPDPSQVANAIKVKKNEGKRVDDFPGVPIFQDVKYFSLDGILVNGQYSRILSRSLVLTSQNKRYRPAFFRKEDLEDSLSRAAHQQNRLNPALRRGDIQVSILEDIINDMKVSPKENSLSKWGDIVFIPPGFNVSTENSENGADNQSAT